MDDLGVVNSACVSHDMALLSHLIGERAFEKRESKVDAPSPMTSGWSMSDELAPFHTLWQSTCLTYEGEGLIERSSVISGMRMKEGSFMEAFAIDYVYLFCGSIDGRMIFHKNLTSLWNPWNFDSSRPIRELISHTTSCLASTMDEHNAQIVYKCIGMVQKMHYPLHESHWFMELVKLRSVRNFIPACLFPDKLEQPICCNYCRLLGQFNSSGFPRRA